MNRLTIVHERQNASHAKHHRIVQHAIPVGSTVAIRDLLAKNKLSPAFVGKYTVLQRFSNGGYLLQDTDDSKQQFLDRLVDITQLKVIATPPKPAPASSRVYQVERILNHDGPIQNRSYLVKWKGYQQPTGAAHQDFVDLDIIEQYEVELAARQRVDLTSKSQKRTKSPLVRK